MLDRPASFDPPAATTSFVPAETVLRASSFAACAAVVAMLTIFLVTGTGQDPLQFVHPSDEYASLLLRAPAALRATLAIDNAFVVFYTTAFVALAVILLRAGAARPFVLVATVLLLALGILDLAENLHFLVMLRRAELGIVPSATEVELQVLESLMKFHVSYGGLFLLGFAMPRRSQAERALANLSWWVQLPVGILIYVVPAGIAVPLVFVRFAYFVIALLLLATTLGRVSVSDAAAAGSGAPA